VSTSVIVNADDLGLSLGVNAGIADAHEHGIVTSASLMVLQAAAEHAAAWAASTPRLGLGLHVDLCEWEYVADEWRLRYQRVDLDDAAAVADEVARQVVRFVELVGTTPTHLDSHQHVHRDGAVAEAVTQAADSIGCPVRDRPPVRYCGEFYGQSGKGYPLPELVEVPALLALLDSLEPGWIEIGCHPGYAGDVDTSYCTERTVEVRTLCDPAVRAHIDRSTLSLATYRDIR
jgi:predicted glycoside hydrolase/deacetylase ChbG (UPF0249 family)